MSLTAPTSPPASDFADGANPLHLSNGFVWAPLRGAWLQAKPEELVRQRYVHKLHTEYDYALNQMAQERRTQAGRRSPKADIIVAIDAGALRDNRDYVLVVETKAERVTIQPTDYWQGESYARAVGCEFMVAHNEKETRPFRLVPGAPGSRIDIESAPTLADVSSSARLDRIRRATKAFSREEFRKLLYECHSILRDTHKLDPGAAFDEISKVLFIKMFYERGGDERFTVSYLDDYSRVRRGREDQVMSDLFEDTKKDLEEDQLFESGDRLNITYATFKRLVGKLERFNLSSTSEDVKGIAFERFLGETFRGELGQYFTPRPVVDFMVELVDPQEGELICDPACGTGGFLIRAFEHIRNQIEQSIQAAKDAEESALEREALQKGWPDEILAENIEESRHELNAGLDPTNHNSRLGRLSRETFFGADAEARAARTSKMNMIMHGDGHGGIYYHDGLLDTGGMLRGRFDVVLTNPPFGASVGADQLVGDTPQTRMVSEERSARSQAGRFGDLWTMSFSEMSIAEREHWPILRMFDVGRDPIGGPIGVSRVRNSRPTETVFLERAVSLLRPGGRAAIVLPDGLLNNPSMQWLRDYCDGVARLKAVISLPQDVFASAKATVKTSILVLERFTSEDIDRWHQALEEAVRTLELGEIGLLRTEADQEWTGDLRAGGLIESEVRTRLADIEQAISRGDTVALSQARSRFNSSFSIEQRKVIRDSQRILARARHVIETELGRRKLIKARELFDFPVFMAEVAQAGITSTGATGHDVPNELHDVLADYQRWVASCEPTVDSAD